jgi:hypothetical protein
MLFESFWSFMKAFYIYVIDDVSMQTLPKVMGTILTYSPQRVPKLLNNMNAYYGFFGGCGVVV